MRIDEYIWSRNPRGLHNIGAFMRPLNISRYTTPRFGWAKLVSENVEFVEDSVTLMAAGVTPIVRVYLTPQQNAVPLSQQAYSLVTAYAAAGIKWFELYNEPNLPVEWPSGTDVNYNNGNLIRQLVDNWIPWAEHVVSVGGYPGFISLAETDSPPLATVFWVDALLNYVAQAYHSRFVNIAANGLWFSTHPYIFNHFYQEAGSLTSARSPETLNNREPGWHFEYPYDPICQASDPGRTVYGGTAQTPNGDPVGLTATGQFMNERSAMLFGTQAVPVVGTEGGIELPANNGQIIQRDTRYPGVTQASNGEATVAMFDWIATSAQPWFFGLTLWKEDDYYNYGGHALERLQRTEPILKNVPPIDVINTGGTSGTVAVPYTPTIGPGPVHGAPDFHIVILAPDLDPTWFFDTAFAYWNAFRPIVTTVTDYIHFFTYERSLAATIIATPASAELMTRIVHEPYANILFDLIVADGSLDTIVLTLNDRAQRNAPFG